MRVLLPLTLIMLMAPALIAGPSPAPAPVYPTPNRPWRPWPG